jgi:predicted ArsR family transcriptional regulator
MKEAELLQQVQDALTVTETEDGAMTVMQLAKALDISAEKVRIRLRRLMEEGVIELVKVRRRKMNGVISPVVAYASVNKMKDKNE